MGKRSNSFCSFCCMLSCMIRTDELLRIFLQTFSSEVGMEHVPISGVFFQRSFFQQAPDSLCDFHFTFYDVQCWLSHQAQERAVPREGNRHELQKGHAPRTTPG